jgi:uncharacterized protein YcaQ
MNEAASPARARRRPPSLADLRRYALSRSLFTPTTLPRALRRLAFVQADPIRAPARAQDLTLRHRVAGYRAGDLEARYARLPIEEDFFVNYGFVPRAVHALMHPRTPRTVWSVAQQRQAAEVLAFVRERGAAHPREVDERFAHGRVKNWFGGSSRASTQLLDSMHYRGLLRVLRRDGGTRVYAAAPLREAAADADAAMDALVDTVLAAYAPLPQPSLSAFVMHLRAAAPQWEARRRDALARARQRLPSAEVEGLRWYWPAGERVPAARSPAPDRVRLLAPFDPVVHDRRRFEAFWGWAYRFEAYVPAPQRVRGHYALPMLWRDEVIGWANLRVEGGRLVPAAGYVAGRPPRDAGFRAALDDELHAMGAFLGLG